ncbi:Zn(2)-C6 fungal-type DNA-binding domain protein [Niveomyces insectorum RCEF 264]|uniref:Zn(2)-C6 fungal-type DNA-binding domain protein n=1 Tax=Niveomyces insectorum RCEF 264 TaxID=1081102 RepID=A0A167P1D5_9HYPO|nr:Zn(2)-C6 fungal-type DNA-binding domain protein [Niveomyces insectorum RCEF 264]
MAGSLVARKRTIQCRTKVKTGCATCRIRKVKCDENKPFCRKCVDTGRTCDGYESPFRHLTSQSIKSGRTGGVRSGAGVQPPRPALPALGEVAPEDIELLNRYFSTKTMFDVKLGCDEEAKQILQASLTDPPIRHAVSSLRALREHLETSGEVTASFTQETPSRDYEYGVQQYCMALGGLASNLSSPDSNGLKSALLCCQIFISIEQVRGNYGTMAQHIIQGLSIMHEYRARPYFAAANKLVAAHHDHLPLLDVFVIKLFSAPCKFAEPPATAVSSETTENVCPISSHQQQSAESRSPRTIAPDMRTELTRIAATTLEFLDKVLHAKSAKNARQLLTEKASLLSSLESWLADLELVHGDIKPPSVELLAVTFLRLFHKILRVVILGALESSPSLDATLRTENDQIKDIASIIVERVKAYKR